MTARDGAGLGAPPGGDGGRRWPAAAHGADPQQDREVVTALLAGDEGAFLGLARRWHSAMVRIARCYVPTDEAAEDLARASWPPLLKALPSWRGAVSLATLIVATVVRCARALAGDPDAALTGSGCGPGSSPSAVAEPASAADGPEPTRALEYSAERLKASEGRAALRRAVDALPPSLRLVFTVRDVVGCGAEEAREALGLPEVRQHALLHRARSLVLAAVALQLSACAGTAPAAGEEPG